MKRNSVESRTDISKCKIYIPKGLLCLSVERTAV